MTLDIVLASDETEFSVSMYLTKIGCTGIVGSVNMAQNVFALCERSSIATRKSSCCKNWRNVLSETC